MSVCIAAICWGAEKKLNDDRIVVVTDRKMSGIEFSNEDASVKNMWLSSQWGVVFAGADISPCVPIIDAVRKEINRPEKENKLEVVSAAFESAYQEHLSKLAAAKCLGRWRLSMKDFLETGRKKFGADVFDSLCHQIEQVKLQCKFLVYGFDESLEPHIFTVANPGYAEVRDTPGYFAIGNGDFAAMSILGFFRQNIVNDIYRTCYNVAAAKFMAERASDVGKESFGFILPPEGGDGIIYVNSILQIARNAWENGGKPSAPSGIIESIKTALQADIEEGNERRRKRKAMSEEN